MLDFYAVAYQVHLPLVRGVVPHPLLVAEFTKVCELLLAKHRRTTTHTGGSTAGLTTDKTTALTWLGQFWPPA